MLTGREFGIKYLRNLAKEKNDEALAREAHRQQRELVVERIKLAELEPARLKWWRELAASYRDGADGVERFEGAEALLDWAEKGVAAADRAVSARYDVTHVRELQVWTRLTLLRALVTHRPPGWEKRAGQFPVEIAEKHPQHATSVPNTCFAQAIASFGHESTEDHGRKGAELVQANIVHILLEGPQGGRVEDD